MKPPFLILSAVLFTALSVVGTASAQLVVTYEDPGVQTTSDSNAQTLDFNSLGARTASYTWTSVGTFSSFTTTTANVYGGAGGAGYYVSIPVSKSVTLDLINPVLYTGFWWSAGDPRNTVTLNNVSDGVTNQIAQLTTASVINAIGQGPYPGNPYYGNPNPNFLHQAGGEPFAYLNIYSTDLAYSWNQIIFSQSSVGGGGAFEFDNLSVDTNLVSTISGTSVAVPEPSTYALFGLGAVALVIAGRRRHSA